ncbi:MAG: hypothetical protein KDA65_18855, partial [Planctomycetaceae bacterium]|nr:hypothetical protein [Planctomycetaceae bacterium]
LYVPTSRTPWPAPGRGKPRSAGVNAFGLGGFNLHVALEEYIGKGATTVTVIQSFDSTEAHIELKKEKGVAIIGRGCLLPQARNIKELQVFLTNPQSDKSYLSDFQYDWRRHKIPPRQLEQADPLHFYLLEAVDQALEEAGLSIEDCQRERVGTIVESQLGGDFTDHIQLGLRFPEIAQELCDVLKEDRCSTETVDSIIEQYEQRCQTQWPQYRDDSGSFHHSSLASRIVRTLDFQGPALMLEDASEIKAALFETAFQLLESGDCDVVICAAGSRHLGHASISQGSHSVEGAGAVILKKWNDAIRDGDAIYATLTEEDLSKRIRCDEWPEFISFGIGSKILQVLIQSCFPDSIN